MKRGSQEANRCLRLLAVLLAAIVSSIDKVSAVAGLGYLYSACLLLAAAFIEAVAAITIIAVMALVYGSNSAAVLQAMQFSITRISAKADKALQALHMASSAAASGADSDSSQFQSPSNTTGYIGLFTRLVSKGADSAAKHMNTMKWWAQSFKNSITTLKTLAVGSSRTHIKNACELLCSFKQWISACISGTPQQQPPTRRIRRRWGRRQWDMICDHNNSNTSLPSWAHMEARAGLSTFAEGMVTQDPSTPQPQPETRQQRRTRTNDNNSNDTCLPSWAAVEAIAWLYTFTQWMESNEQATHCAQVHTRTPWAATYDSPSNTDLPSWALDPVHANVMQATATQSMKVSSTAVEPVPSPVNVECDMPESAPSTPASITPTLRKTGSSSKKTVRPQWRI